MNSVPLRVTHVNADNSPVHVTVLLSDLNNTVDPINVTIIGKPV